MINNGMSWLSLGNYINPKARNTELSNDYNQLTNRPIITLTGTSQNPIKLWKLDVGLYILNGYVQHTDALLSEARGLFVSVTVGIVNGKYVISAFIPFWEGQYEYILPSLNSETYTEHQMIRMITQGNSLTLDNIREYFPTQDYHPTTKKYVDETMDAIRNELGKMGLNNNDVQSLIKENRRRDIAIQALLSQNSDKMVTIDEEVHNISMDYSLDNGIATINTLEGSTLVNVSKDTEYDKVLSYEQDIVENTNTVDLEVDGNLNPIIVGDTLVNVCTQNNPTAITNEYTVEGSNHFALQDEVEGNCRPIIQGNTIVNRSKTKDNTPLTTYVSEVEGNEMNLVDDTDTHVRVDKLVGNTMVSPMGSYYGTQTAGIYSLKNGRIQSLIENGNYYIKKENGELCKTKPNTTYTVILDGTIECNDKVPVVLFYRIDNKTTKTISTFHIENNSYVNKIVTFTSKNEDTFGFYFSDYDKITNIDIKYMILEGDYTNKPIPQEYFEGLKNSYEDGYIPSDVWCNYNKGTINNSNIMSTIISEHSFEYKAQSSFSENISPANIMRIDRLNPNTTYTIGFKTNASCIMNMLYDNNDESQYTVIMGTNHSFTPNIFSMYSFTTPAVFNASHIRLISTDTSVRSITFSDIILLEGDYTSNPPTYEEVMERSGKYRCKVEVQGENYNQTQTVYLNSPLLKGDEVVYKEGKLCHYHKMGKVVLDGDEKWTQNYSSGFIEEKTKIFRSINDFQDILPGAKVGVSIKSENFKQIDASAFAEDNEGIIPCSRWWDSTYRLGIRINKSKLSTQDINGLKQWLSENPTTVVYELANPYYETISTSELCLPITTNCKLLTSSNIPLTTMSTRVFTEEVNILANTQYSLNFNSDVASTVNITLGGTVLSNQAIVKGYNKLSITTPSTLVDNLLIIEGSGVNISEIVVTEYDEGVCEYIEGLKSSFEDGLIPENKILEISEGVHNTTNTSYFYDATIPSELVNKTCTLIVKRPKESPIIEVHSTYWGGGYFSLRDSELITRVIKLTDSKFRYTVIGTQGNTFRADADACELFLFKGDWTHLHLTEEDLNHLGQYKVEYKVTGKNKFDKSRVLEGYTPLHKANANIEDIVLDATFATSNVIKVIPNTIYTNNCKSQFIPYYYDLNGKFLLRYVSTNLTQFTIPDGVYYMRFRYRYDNDFTENLQLEEGTVATEYEPYKESIQTVYLNSPLLEGDTIEEIDGEVYHVHRYYKTILNGNEYWCENSYTEQHEDKTYIVRYSSYAITPKIKSCGYIKCDKVTGGKSLSINYPSVNDLMHDDWAWYLILSKNKLSTPDTNGLKQWLSENPITVVYELATPTYELIPSSSIVCKSYPNGHLDFDTNVHIDNTVNFVKANLPITYANTSTNYKLQFVSNKDMENVTINVLGNIMENVTITKGLNKISFTSPSDATNILTFEGIGYAYISNVQLVATEKDINYFKGLYSTYECGLIEDESNENYGKYEVNIVSYNAPIQFGKGGKIE